jgi:hypothetical protein
MGESVRRPALRGFEGAGGRVRNFEGDRAAARAATPRERVLPPFKNSA